MFFKECFYGNINVLKKCLDNKVVDYKVKRDVVNVVFCNDCGREGYDER